MNDSVNKYVQHISKEVADKNKKPEPIQEKDKSALAAKSAEAISQGFKGQRKD